MQSPFNLSPAFLGLQNFCERMAFPVPCMQSSEEEVAGHCKLLGERTWGGVVGIDWKGHLVICPVSCVLTCVCVCVFVRVS